VPRAQIAAKSESDEKTRLRIQVSASNEDQNALQSDESEVNTNFIDFSFDQTDASMKN
jgi:hypothetical protein